MPLSHSIARHTVIQAGAKIANIALGTISIALLARQLGVEGYGQYTIIVAFLQLFGVLGDMGLSLIAIQLMAEHKAQSERYFANILGLRVVTATLCLGSAPVIALLFPYPPVIHIGIALMALSLFLSSLIQLFTTPFQVNVRMDFPALADLVGRLTLLVGILAIMRLGGGLYLILGIITLGNALQLGILALSSRRFLRLHLAWEWPIWRMIIMRTWPIALSIAFNLVYLRADTIILSLTANAQTVGVYGLAYRVFEVLVTIPMMVMGIVLAQFATAWAESRRCDFERYFALCFEGMASLAFPIAVGGWLLATPITLLIGGSDFAASGPILQILMIACTCVWFSTLYGHLINVVHAQRTMIAGYAAGAIIGLSGYLIFIPRYGSLGAAWMTVIAELVVLSATGLVFSRIAKLGIPWRGIWRPLLASGLMGLAIFPIQGQHLWLTIPLGAFIYSAVLLSLGGLSRRIIKAFVPSFLTKYLPH